MVLLLAPSEGAKRCEAIGLLLVDPEADGVLAVRAGLSKERESFCERYVEKVDVDKVRVPFGQHPGVVSEDHPGYQIDEVVSSQRHHQEGLADACDPGKSREAVPPIRTVLEEVYDAATHVP